MRPMNPRSVMLRDHPPLGSIVPGVFTPVLAKHSKSSVHRLSFMGRMAVLCTLAVRMWGSKWSRSPLRGDHWRIRRISPKPVSGPRHVWFRLAATREVFHHTSTAAVLENLHRIARVETP